MPIASPDSCFWVNEGPIVQSVKDLRDALEGMTDEKYGYHANSEKNDFAKWIDEALADEALAQDMRSVKSRAGALRVVEKHLKNYAE